MSEVLNAQDMCMDWDDEIQEDGQEYIVLDEGDYVFEVTNMERGRSKGGGKIPPCNMATLMLSVDAGNGKTASCRTNILLYKTLEWKVSQFFRSIGQKKEGEKVKMNWNNVVGSVGMAHFKPRKYYDNDGNERQANDVGYFIDYNAEEITKARGGVPEGFTKVEDDKEDELPF